MTSLTYVKERRNMPFIKRGMSVEVDGQIGKVTSGNYSGNINVLFDGTKSSVNCHPKWETRYFDKKGNVVADYRDGDGKTRTFIINEKPMILRVFQNGDRVKPVESYEHDVEGTVESIENGGLIVNVKWDSEVYENDEGVRSTFGSRRLVNGLVLT